jgi:hypothetical protein
MSVMEFGLKFKLDDGEWSGGFSSAYQAAANCLVTTEKPYQYNSNLPLLCTCNNQISFFFYQACEIRGAMAGAVAATIFFPC